MVRLRWVVVASSIAVIGLGAWTGTKLSPLLANSLAVPGTDSQRARAILRDRFGESDDGTFTVVFPGQRDTDPNRAGGRP